MLPRADINLNRPPASLEASTRTVSATDTRQEVFRRLTQIAIGKEVSATVNKLLDDGTFLVKVADTAARMALPVGTKVGDNLSMVFIAREPRPTFLLTQQGGSAVTSFSDAARLVDQLLHAAAKDGMVATLVARSALLGSPAGGAQIATALQDALTSSGLFYESHLQDWISGGRSTADLLREPQAQLNRAAGGPAEAAQQDAGNPDLARLAANMRELGDGAQKLMHLLREAQLQAGNPATTDADVIARSQSALPVLDRESSRLINLQLHTLEHQQVRWKGELWPGQRMEWEINEDTPDGSSPEAQQSVWSSAVRFELPHLGDISATIRLIGDRVHVQVNTGSEDTAAALRTYGGMLADALEAAGSPLDLLLVKRDEAA